MAWIRIDDHFYDHPKWATAPGDSIALWLAAMAWCNRNESFDGFVPSVKLAGLVKVRNVKQTCDDLVKREALTVHGDGYLIRNYAEWQQNEKVKAIREKRAANGKKGAAARWGAMANPMANAIASAMPIAMANPMAKPENSMANSWQTPWQTDGNENAPPPTTHSVLVTTQLDDLLLSSVSLYAMHVYDANPSACRIDPERYMAGIAKNTLRERGAELRAYVARHPQATAQELAAHVLRVPGISVRQSEAPPAWQADPACPHCDGSGLVNTGPEGGPATYDACDCRRPFAPDAA